MCLFYYNTNFDIFFSLCRTHAFTLYFLDSHSYTADDDEDEYDYIKSEQLDWIIKSARSFDRKPNAAAFFHIPIWEYHDQDALYPDARLGEAREDISSPNKNKISALEAFKSGRYIIYLGK